MRFNRTDVVTGLALSGAVALVFTAALRAGVSSTGLRGDIEVVASALFILTLPAGALAALCGRLVVQSGLETAFWVTGGAWILLTLPYGAFLSRGVRRLLRKRMVRFHHSSPGRHSALRLRFKSRPTGVRGRRKIITDSSGVA